MSVTGFLTVSQREGNRLKPGSPKELYYILVFCLVTQSCLTLLWPHGLPPARLLCPWDSPGKNTGVGCHSLLQEIFPSQGLNPRLLHWQVDSSPRSHQGRLTTFVGRREKIYVWRNLWHAGTRSHSWRVDVSSRLSCLSPETVLFLAHCPLLPHSCGSTLGAEAMPMLTRDERNSMHPHWDVMWCGTSEQLCRCQLRSPN